MKKTINEDWLLSFSCFLLLNQHAITVNGLSYKKDGILWVKSQFETWCNEQNIYDIPEIKFSLDNDLVRLTCPTCNRLHKVEPYSSGDCKCGNSYSWEEYYEEDKDLDLSTFVWEKYE